MTVRRLLQTDSERLAEECGIADSLHAPAAAAAAAGVGVADAAT